MKVEQIPYGFSYGPANVERLMSEPKKGAVYIGVISKKTDQSVSVYVTKTGKTRVYKNGVELK